ncbi:MAG: hypothetical protein ABEJ68_02920 [Halobacteriaceae archaeon]
MVAKVELRTVESVPESARVGHYDELGEKAKEELPALAAADGAADVADAAEASLADYDLVKFTDYYRVQRVS